MQFNKLMLKQSLSELKTLLTTPTGLTGLLLNIGHAIDHMFLLIFAVAVSSIALDFGFSSWEDLMPYSVGAFVFFGLGALPAGRLGDLYGRRILMAIFFFGMGVTSILVAFSQNPWQLAIALSFLGAFASIYHPVGIPMLVRDSHRPGRVIGINGLAGNFGIAIAAILTGFLVSWINWRAAFFIPGIFAIICGFIFIRVAPQESESPAKSKRPKTSNLSKSDLAKVFMVMTVTAVTGSAIFTFMVNGNMQILGNGFKGHIENPAVLGTLLAIIYMVASFTQILVGNWIDRFSMKRLQFWVALVQIPLLIFIAYADGWMLFIALLVGMAFIFGSIPFNDTMIIRYVDDQIRSRVAGMRYTVSFAISSLAVWLLGPMVKDKGFLFLLWIMAAIALIRVIFILQLPDDSNYHKASQPQ